MKKGHWGALLDKYQSAFLVLVLLFISCIVRGQSVYRPSNSGYFTPANKPYGIATPVSTDGRTMKADTVNGLFRPYNGTAEVLTYLPTGSQYRVGQFPIVINVGGSLQSNGTFLGGQIQVWWFLRGQADTNLVRMDSTASGTCAGCLLKANNLSDVQSLLQTLINLNLNNVDNTSDATKWAAIAALTNKSISGLTNTISNIPNSALTNNAIGLTLTSIGSTPGVTTTPAQLGTSLVLNIPNGNGSNDGFILHGDWARFNSKIDSTTQSNDSVYDWRNGTAIFRYIIVGGSGGIASLNGLTTSTQTFATGTSGSDFNIVSSISTHTFNFPNSSASNRGLLTSTDWSTFNAKQATIAPSNTIDQYWNGFENFVNLNTDSITEGTNHQFYTNARARASISLTTTGSSGAATYNNSTGVLNIPNYTGGSGTDTATLVLPSLTRTSSGTTITLGLNTANPNTWTAAQTLNNGLVLGSNTTFATDNTYSIGTSSVGANIISSRFFESPGILSLLTATSNPIVFAPNSATKMQLAVNGQLQLSAYTTSTSFTGTPLAFLQTDASGNLIQTAVGSIQSALTLTTTGSSGPSTLIGTTLNIPQYTGGSGTVTSVGLSLPATLFNVTGSPVTGSGTLTGAFVNFGPSQVLIGDTINTGQPELRKMVVKDIPAFSNWPAEQSYGIVYEKYTWPTNFADFGIFPSANNGVNNSSMTFSAGTPTVSFGPGAIWPNTIVFLPDRPTLLRHWTDSIWTTVTSPISANSTGYGPAIVSFNSAVANSIKSYINMSTSNNGRITIANDAGTVLNTASGTAISQNDQLLMVMTMSDSTITVGYKDITTSSAFFTCSYTFGLATSGSPAFQPNTAYWGLFGAGQVTGTMTGTIQHIKITSTDTRYPNNIALGTSKLQGIGGQYFANRLITQLNTAYPTFVNMGDGAGVIGGGTNASGTHYDLISRRDEVMAMDPQNVIFEHCNDTRYGATVAQTEARILQIMSWFKNRPVQVWITVFPEDSVNAASPANHLTDLKNFDSVTFSNGAYGPNFHYVDNWNRFTFGGNRVQANWINTDWVHPNQLMYNSIDSMMVAVGAFSVIDPRRRSAYVTYAHDETPHADSLAPVFKQERRKWYVPVVNDSLNYEASLIQSNHVTGQVGISTNFSVPTPPATAYVLWTDGGIFTKGINGALSIADRSNQNNYFSWYAQTNLIQSYNGTSLNYMNPSGTWFIGKNPTSVTGVPSGIYIGGSISSNSSIYYKGAGLTLDSMTFSQTVAGPVPDIAYAKFFPMTLTATAGDSVRQSPTVEIVGPSIASTNILSPARSMHSFLIDAGDAVFAPSASGYAPITLPAGANVTSPIQGDLWAITGHLYYRDQSTTYDLLTSGGSSTYQQVLTNGSTLTGPNNVTNTGQTFTWTNAGTGLWKWSGLSHDTTSSFGLLGMAKDSSVRAFSWANVADEISPLLPTFNIYPANGLTAAGGDSIYLGGTLNQLTTITQANNQFSITGGRVIVGLSSSTDTWAPGNVSSAIFVLGGSTLNDASTASSGTVTNVFTVGENANTLTATNTSVTYTNAYSFFINGAPIPSTNITITNPYAFGVSGNSLFTGNVSTSQGSVVSTTHILGNNSSGTPPTIAAGAGAGTTPTISIQGTDMDGLITVTAGTLPTGSGAVIVTVTFGYTFPNHSYVTLTPADASSALLSGATMVYTSGSTTGFTVNSGTTGLGATTTYQWYYHVGGF